MEAEKLEIFAEYEGFNLRLFRRGAVLKMSWVERKPAMDYNSHGRTDHHVENIWVINATPAEIQFQTVNDYLKNEMVSMRYEAVKSGQIQINNVKELT